MNVKSVLYFTMIFDLLSIVGSVIYFYYTGNDNFSEGGNISRLSLIQLLIISWISYKILQARKPANEPFNIKHPAFIWAIISIGFLYLAGDEYFCFHENMDKLIHKLLEMKETNLTDRIDDIIIGIYGLIGIGVLYLYREELRWFKDAIPLLVTGFVLLFMTVVFDILTNGRDMLQLLFDDDIVNLIYDPLGQLEESCKVMAEACYLVSFYMVLTKARAIKNKTTNDGVEPLASPASKG